MLQFYLVRPARYDPLKWPWTIQVTSLTVEVTTKAVKFKFKIKRQIFFVSSDITKLFSTFSKRQTSSNLLPELFPEEIWNRSGNEFDWFDVLRWSRKNVNKPLRSLDKKLNWQLLVQWKRRKILHAHVNHSDLLKFVTTQKLVNRENVRF